MKRRLLSKDNVRGKMGITYLVVCSLGNGIHLIIKYNCLIIACDLKIMRQRKK